MEALIDINLARPSASLAIPSARPLQQSCRQPIAHASILNADGLTRHTAMFRPARGDSPAWEHHIQTIALGDGRFQIISLTGRKGTRLRMHKQAGGAFSEDVAATVHDELASRALDQDLHALSISAIVELQMKLCMHRLGGRSAHVIIAGHAISLDRFLSVCGQVNDEQETQLAAAKSRSILASISGRCAPVTGLALRDDGDGDAIASIIEAARADVAMLGFDLHLDQVTAHLAQRSN